MTEGRRWIVFWGLVVIAITLHFSFFEWGGHDFGFLGLRTHQEAVAAQYGPTSVTVKNDLSLSLCCGLVFPLALIGLGVYLNSAALKPLLDGLRVPIEHS